MVGGIITFVMGLLKLFIQTPKPPTREAMATGQAAAAETNLGTEEKANAEVLAATAAGDAADDLAIRDPSSLREPDINSRD